MVQFFRLRPSGPKQRALAVFLKSKLQSGQELLSVGNSDKPTSVNVIGGDNILQLNQAGIAVCNVDMNNNEKVYYPIAFYDTSNIHSREIICYKISVHNYDNFDDGLDNADSLYIDVNGNPLGTDKTSQSITNSYKLIRSSGMTWEENLAKKIGPIKVGQVWRRANDKMEKYEIIGKDSHPDFGDERFVVKYSYWDSRKGLVEKTFLWTEYDMQMEVYESDGHLYLDKKSSRRNKMIKSSNDQIDTQEIIKDLDEKICHILYLTFREPFWLRKYEPGTKINKDNFLITFASSNYKVLLHWINNLDYYQGDFQIIGEDVDSTKQSFSSSLSLDDFISQFSKTLSSWTKDGFIESARKIQSSRRNNMIKSAYTRKDKAQEVEDSVFVVLKDGFEGEMSWDEAKKNKNNIVELYGMNTGAYLDVDTLDYPRDLREDDPLFKENPDLYQIENQVDVNYLLNDGKPYNVKDIYDKYVQDNGYYLGGFFYNFSYPEQPLFLTIDAIDSLFFDSGYDISFYNINEVNEKLNFLKRYLQYPKCKKLYNIIIDYKNQLNNLERNNMIKSAYTREDYDRFDEYGNFIPYNPTEEELAKKDEIKKVLKQELSDAYEPDPMDDYVGYDSTNERIDMACERVAKQFGVDTDFVDQIAGEIDRENIARANAEPEYVYQHCKDKDRFWDWYNGEDVSLEELGIDKEQMDKEVNEIVHKYVNSSRQIKSSNEETMSIFGFYTNLVKQHINRDFRNAFKDWVQDGIHGRDLLTYDRWMEIFDDFKNEFEDTDFSEDEDNLDEFTVYTDDKEITVRKEDDNKWHGSDGKTFMGYLKPQDVLHWYRQDYGKAWIDSSRQIKSALDTVKVTFDNGDTIVTDYNADVGREEIAKYYMHNYFNVGNEDELHQVVKVEFPGNINSARIPEKADLDMAYQLEGYIESDHAMYDQFIVPVIKNLERKMKRGIFDYDKSLILWQHVADEGAKRYVKELGGPSYNVATRKEVAKNLAEYYKENYDVNGDIYNPIN